MADNSIVKRLRQFLNPSIKGKMTNALLEALAEGDSINRENILAVKPQMFVATATGRFLEKRMANMGVDKPIGVGIDDESFRQLGIKQTNTKLVRNIFLDVLETFYGADAVRASVRSIRPQSYNLADGMTLIIQANQQKSPLTVTFTTTDFSSIDMAKAEEVAAVISRTAFSYDYPIVAFTETDFDTKQVFVKIQTTTNGHKGSVSVIGGSAQNELMFPGTALAQSKYGTQYTISSSNQFIRFTWTGGADPGLGFLTDNSFVNIYGDAFVEMNKGSFKVENYSGGPLGQAFFEILNPNFDFINQNSVVVMTSASAISGDGVATSRVDIQNLGANRTNNIVTIFTTSPHGFITGQDVTVAHCENTTFNGTFTVLSTPDAYTVTFFNNGPDAVSSGGTIEVDYTILSQPSGAVRSSGIVTITTQTPHSLSVGNQVIIENVIDSSFNGVFNITAVTSNTFTYTQDYSNDLTFFTTKKAVISQQSRYASVYETSPYELTIFLPISAQIIRRDLIGSWHVHESASDKSFLGSYSFDTTALPITSTSTSLSESVNAGESKTIVSMANTTNFPDSTGYITLEWGTAREEGPIRFLARPSDGSLLLDASYRFRFDHTAGSDVTLLKDTAGYSPKTDGTDYQAYLTSSQAARIEAESLMNKLVASGIFLNIILVYPEGPGLQDITQIYEG